VGVGVIVFGLFSASAAPASVTATAPSATGVAAAASSLALASKSATVGSAGNLTVKLTCPSSQTVCLGSVALKAQSTHTTLKKRKLASATFIIPGGTVKALSLHLSAKARAFLRRRHSLRARATIEAHDVSSTTRTTVVAKIFLKAAAPAPKRRKH
jgi:endonuclease/exonuclease/phosphatase family metal-dependent hydrolase